MTAPLRSRRNGSEWRADRLVLNKEVMLGSAVRRFFPLLDDVAQDFCRVLRRRVETEGGGEGRCSLTLDPSPDLFRFALEGQFSGGVTPRRRSDAYKLLKPHSLPIGFTEVPASYAPVLFHDVLRLPSSAFPVPSEMIECAMFGFRETQVFLRGAAFGLHFLTRSSCLKICFHVLAWNVPHLL